MEYLVFACLSYIADALFIIDIIVNFRTAVIVKIRGQKVFVKDMTLVSMEYLRGFFIIDLMAVSAPVLSELANWPGELTDGENFFSQEEYEVIFTAAYVMSMLKILRLVRLNTLLQRLYTGTANFQKYVTLIKLLIVLTLAAHLIGCLFWGLCTRSDGTAKEIDGWIVAADLQNAADPGEQYISSVYFALMTLTTVGYGDITASTTGEMGFVIIVMVVGAVLYALLLALLTSLLSQFVSSSRPLAEAMEALDVFLDITDADDGLRTEVMNTLQYQWRLSSTFNLIDTVRELPEALRRHVLDSLHRPMLMKTSFLANADNVFVGELAQHLKMQVCLPGTHVYSTGNLARDMYFIHEGTVLIMAYDQPQVQFSMSEYLQVAKKSSKEGAHIVK